MDRRTQRARCDEPRGEAVHRLVLVLTVMCLLLVAIDTLQVAIHA